MRLLQETSKFMLQNHARIEKELHEFSSSLSDPEKAMRLFDRFKWELEKHFFIEEKAIFAICNLEASEMQIMENIVEDHKIFLNSLKNIEVDLAQGKKINISKFQEMLIKHKSFEDSVLYPKLDELLTKEQKEEIFKRIKGIIKEN